MWSQNPSLKLNKMNRQLKILLLLINGVISVFSIQLDFTNRYNRPSCFSSSITVEYFQLRTMHKARQAKFVELRWSAGNRSAAVSSMDGSKLSNAWPINFQNIQRDQQLYPNRWRCAGKRWRCNGSQYSYQFRWPRSKRLSVSFQGNTEISANLIRKWEN